MHRPTLLAVLAAAILAPLTSACDRSGLARPVELLESPAGPGSGEPNVAVADDGRVYMTWLEPADSGHALRFAILDGDQWSPARTIHAGPDFFVNWADFPSIIVLGNGRLAAHWLQRNGTGTYAYGVRLAQSADSGRTWSDPVTPHRDSSQTEHGFVALWPEDGQVGAAWLDGRNFQAEGHDASNVMMLLSTTIGPDGRLGPELRLDERTCDCCQNSAAMTGDGPIVAYRDRSPDEIRDVAVTRRVGGQWTPGTRVHADEWRIDACPVNGPSVAASGSRVALAWFTAARDSARVTVAFSDDAGATFDVPARVDDGNPGGRVDIDLLDDGSALVTWVERTGGEVAAVRARRVGRDGALGAAVTIAASSAARASGFPRSAITGSNAIFAWTVPGEPAMVHVARVPLEAFR